MTPVKQEFLHDPEKGSHGDCQRAVIASLLDLHISEVPHFYELSKGDPDEFFTLIQEFLNPLGYAWLTVDSLQAGMFFGEVGDIYHEIAGPSPRGKDLWHAVVGKNGQIFHDPHPDNTGLVGEPKDWKYSYLVKTSTNSNTQG